MKEPVDHITRPGLPWRIPGISITECGYDASKVKAITRAEYFAREKELGRQRTAMLTCMTCADTARRWGTWEDDPRQAMDREINWESYGRRARTGHGSLLRDELLAIRALIENHSQEFSSLLEATARRREWLDMKAEKLAKAEGEGER